MPAMVVAVNPTAARGRAAAIAARAAERFEAAGHPVTVLRADRASALEQMLDDAFAAPVDALVAIGGDGMVHTALQRVAGTTTPFGIVAAGTGNDTARSLGLPFRDPDAGVDRIVAALSRPPTAVDAIRLDDGRWVIGAVSAGIDARVNERANGLRRPRGASRYLVALALEFPPLRNIDYTITIDGVRHDNRGVLVTVGNTTTIGGGLRFTPDARVDDGLLDVLIADALTRAELLGLFLRLTRGTHVADPRVRVLRGRAVRIESADVAPPVAFGDGERLGPLPVGMSCVPAAVRMLL